MILIRIVASLALVALTRPAAAQTVAADSLSPGILLRVVLRPLETVPAPATVGSVSANPALGRNVGVFNGRFESWDATGLHVTESRSGMSWSFPQSALVSIDARTGSDRSAPALLRTGLLGAAVGAIGVFYFTSTKYHTLNPFAYGDLSTAITRGALAGFAAGGAYRYLRPAGTWEPVRIPTHGS